MRRHTFPFRLLSRALSPPPPTHPPITALSAWRFRGASLGYFSSDAAAAAAAHDTSKPAAAAAASDGGKEDGQSGKSDQSDAGRPVRGGPVSWLSFLLLLGTGGGIIHYAEKEKKRHIEEMKNRASAVKQEPSVGTAAIGGPFKLLNHGGELGTEKDFLDKWTLLYFGFTHCPDICPDELQKMAAAIDK